LQNGVFTPHHAENGYTWIEGESADERVVAAYSQDVVVRSGTADKTVILVNATGVPGMLVDLSAAPLKIALFDVFGQMRGNVESLAGIVRLPVPVSGYAEVTWTEDVPQFKLSHDGQRACKGE